MKAKQGWFAVEATETTSMIGMEPDCVADGVVTSLAVGEAVSRTLMDKAVSYKRIKSLHAENTSTDLGGPNLDRNVLCWPWRLRRNLLERNEFAFRDFLYFRHRYDGCVQQRFRRRLAWGRSDANVEVSAADCCRNRLQT